MLTYAERRQAYMDGYRSAYETAILLFMDPPADLPATVRAEMREMVSSKGVNSYTMDVLANIIADTPA